MNTFKIIEQVLKHTNEKLVKVAEKFLQNFERNPDTSEETPKVPDCYLKNTYVEEIRAHFGIFLFHVYLWRCS